MNHDMTQAVMRLNARRDRTSDLFQGQLIEEALDVLLAKPNRTGVPWHLVRSALSDARKKLRARAVLHERYAARVRAGGEPTGDGPGILTIELADFIERGVPEPHRSMLKMVAGGSGAEEIARRVNVPPARARERLSRARATAVREWSAP